MFKEGYEDANFLFKEGNKEKKVLYWLVVNLLGLLID